jgi:hypothetical protein
MRKITTKNVSRAIAAYFDRAPTLETARSGKPAKDYYAGQRPGGVGPVVPSVRGMSQAEDDLHLVLSINGSVRVKGAGAHWLATAVSLEGRGLARWSAPLVLTLAEVA